MSLICKKQINNKKKKKNKQKKNIKKYVSQDLNITTLLANNRGGKPEVESDIDCLTRPTIHSSQQIGK